MKKPSLLRKLAKSQKGFTLVELLVAIAIAGIFGSADTIDLHQVITIPIISNNQNTAINQVRNAVHWISRDAQSANSTSIDVPQKFLSLELLEWNSGNWTSHAIDYTLEDNVLWRYYDSGTPGTLIAQYIEPKAPGVTECSWDAINSMLTVTITATVGDETETRTFEVKPRPD